MKKKVPHHRPHIIISNNKVPHDAIVVQKIDQYVDREYTICTLCNEKINWREKCYVLKSQSKPLYKYPVHLICWRRFLERVKLDEVRT